MVFAYLHCRRLMQLGTEVVLAEILDAFKLAPSTKAVKWRMGNISTACVEGEPDLSQLPVVLSRAD